MENLISIVIPVYNAEKYMEKTIQSVICQTYQNWELLLVDDGSVDGSRDIMKRYEGEKIRCFYCDKNEGPANARNIGLANAKGRYLAFVDADDLWIEDKLEKQLDFMRKHKYAFVFTSYEFADETGKRTGCVAHAPARVTYRDILKNTTIAPSTTMFDRRQIPDELLFTPLGVLKEDGALWMKILKNKHTAYGLDEVLMIYRRHDGAYSGNKLKQVWGKWQLYRHVEKMPVLKSLYYVILNTWGAVKRRMK